MRLTMEVAAVGRMRMAAMTVVAGLVLLGGAAAAVAVPLDVVPQTATQGKVYKVGGDVTPPVLTHAVDAEFSKKARDAKYQGVSVVALVVDAHGMPQHVHTARKLGMGLDEKAIEAVRQYRFEPAMRKGQPVAVAITIEVNFKIY
jgi:TonB family protein